MKEMMDPAGTTPCVSVPTGIAPATGSAWSPLGQRVFRAIWIAGLVSNIGTWMQSTATAWLMVTIAPSPVMVSMVQTATSLPIFLLALPAGALADVVDRRRLILFTQCWMFFASFALGALTWAGVVTPWVLLWLTLLLSLGMALNAPAWQAIVPELVQRSEIPAAVALNSAGFNVARFIGPAVGGLVVGSLGAGAAFLCNAASYLGVIAVLFIWEPDSSTRDRSESLVGAMRTGIRFAMESSALRAIFIRSAAFIVCGSALMALLPLIARQRLMVDSEGYGLLVGVFGLGAVAGAVVLPPVRRRLSLNVLAVSAACLFGMAMAAMALVTHYVVACTFLLLGGASWLALLATFNSSVQSIVPAWVRGRALAAYLLVFFGGLAVGSLLWGAVAEAWGLPNALLLASAGLLMGVAATARFRLLEEWESRESP
ncbi:MAG: MFS transporter [Syntrophobacteraceae bacterium]|jgi:MFS family permease|nr:MFS transporter [Syntrophobacteraceae bacterium]